MRAASSTGTDGVVGGVCVNKSATITGELYVGDNGLSLGEVIDDSGTPALGALTGDADGGQRLLDADRRTAEPDWWVAGAVVAHLRGDRPTRDRALAELRWRFPLLPIDRLGLRDPPPPPPPAPPPRKRK